MCAIFPRYLDCRKLKQFILETFLYVAEGFTLAIKRIACPYLCSPMCVQLSEVKGGVACEYHFFIHLLKDGSSSEIFWVGNKAHKFGILKKDSRSYSLMPASTIIFSTFVFAHSLRFSAERRCGTRAVPAHYYCCCSAEQSWSYPESNTLRYSVLNHVVFAMLLLKHVTFPYPCKGRDSVDGGRMSSPRRREARPSTQRHTERCWLKESAKPRPWAQLFYALPSAHVMFCVPLWPRGWEISLSLERELWSKQNCWGFVFTWIIAHLVNMLESQAGPCLKRWLLRFQ